MQDEMKALQRLNTLFFLIGYLGFVACFITDLILVFTKARVQAEGCGAAERV